ncbi:MAG: MoaD/ThiS family protein, partial [Chloroflexota bacterium]
LRKIFNYYPGLRADLLDQAWEQSERIDAHGTPWMVPVPLYQPRLGWRVLVNGRVIDYTGGVDTPVGEGDTLQIFPPGR